MALKEANFAKKDVKSFWESNPCNAEMGRGKISDREFFDAIENSRYAHEPEIHEFAQFTRYHGRRVLEVGVGMGTDYIQWIRAGAEVHGIDLTEEAIRLTTRRLEAYGLEPTGSLQCGDAENLPFPNDYFDLVYSWGVVHHSPDTQKALSEILRVCKPGGEAKIMIYNKWSAVAIMFWTKFALLRLKPFRSISDVFAKYVESPGTKVYSRKEAASLLEGLPVDALRIRCYRKYFWGLSNYPRPIRQLIRFTGEILVFLLGGVERAGYFLTLHYRKRKLPAA